MYNRIGLDAAFLVSPGPGGREAIRSRLGSMGNKYSKS